MKSLLPARFSSPGFVRARIVLAVGFYLAFVALTLYEYRQGVLRPATWWNGIALVAAFLVLPRNFTATWFLVLRMAGVAIAAFLILVLPEWL